MPAFFPSLLPDELLYSVVARYADMVAYPSQNALLHDVFGASTARDMVDLPSYLDAFVDRLPVGHRHTAQQLIDSATLLPYYRPFASQEIVKSTEASMRRHQRVGARQILQAGGGLVRAGDRFRFCSTCVEADADQYGAPYWRRVHQLPGVLICPLHRLALFESSVPRRLLRVFRSCASALTEEVAQIRFSSEHVSALHTLAVGSEWLLLHRPKAHSPDVLRTRLDVFLTAAGWMTKKRYVRVSQLKSAVSTQIPPDLLLRLGCHPTADGDPFGWVDNLLRVNPDPARVW